MCRLLGVVSSETTDFRFSLHEAPRSLSVLSSEHPDGWGVAIHSRVGWDLQKHAACALRDDRFCSLAAEARGEVLLAHIRKGTVGAIRIPNTHPFRRGPWVFAHNGTVEDIAYLEERTSSERRAEIEGETDSERLFAFLMTVIDSAGAAEGAEHAKGVILDDAIADAMAAATKRDGFGACNFLLSDGATLYAHRSGRTLFLLERRRGDEIRTQRTSHETEATVETPWSMRRRALLIASERMTGEPWVELSERTLLRIDGGKDPTFRCIRGSLRDATASPAEPPSAHPS